MGLLPISRGGGTVLGFEDWRGHRDGNWLYAGCPLSCSQGEAHGICGNDGSLALPDAAARLLAQTMQLWDTKCYSPPTVDPGLAGSLTGKLEAKTTALTPFGLAPDAAKEGFVFSVHGQARTLPVEEIDIEEEDAAHPEAPNTSGMDPA